MADISVDTTAHSTAGRAKFLWGSYWADDSVAVIVGINSANEAVYYRTVNGGASWSETTLETFNVAGAVACWYDAETPGITTTLVHIVYADIGLARVSYNTVDVATGTRGTRRTAASVSVSTDDELFVFKTRNGNLIMGQRSTTGGTSGVYRSTDSGVNWTSRANVWESTSEDECLGVTVNTGDGADGGVVFWDWSADELSVKVYDDSADAWNETSISGSMTDPGANIVRNFSVGTFRSNGKAFLAAFSEVNTATADLKTWLLDITSVTAGAAGVTAETDVISNTAAAVCPAVFIDPRTDDVYVCYLTGSAYQATLGPFYKKSSDTGSTWGSAVALSDALEDDYRALSVGGTCFTNGGKIMPVWYDDDDDDYLTSVFADVVLTSDVAVSSDVYSGSQDKGAFPQGPFWSDPNTAVIVYVSNASFVDLCFRRTTDGGQTWGSEQVVEAGTITAFDCWYEQSTPGRTGTRLYVAWTDSTAGDFSFSSIDVASGGWASVVDINATATAGGAGTGIVFITMTRNGNLVAGQQNSSLTAGEAWKSSNGGASWSSITSPWESAAFDTAFAATCNTGDDSDAAVVFFDQPVGLSVKVYDDSANTWSETTISGGPTSYLTSADMVRIATRRSDGHAILVSWTTHDSATADLKCWDLNINTVTAGSASVTAKTDVNTDTAEAGGVGIFIDQTNDDIYVAYLRGSAFNDTVGVFYKKSTDDGTTWGSEQSYSQQVADDHRSCFSGPMHSTGGGRFMPSFCDDDDNDLFVNYNNSVSIAAVGAGSNPPFDEDTPLLAIAAAERFLNQKLAEELLGVFPNQDQVPWAPASTAYIRDVSTVEIDLTSITPPVEDQETVEMLVREHRDRDRQFPAELIPELHTPPVLQTVVRTIASVLLDLTAILPPLEDQDVVHALIREHQDRYPAFPTDLLASMDTQLPPVAELGARIISSVLMDLTSITPELEDEALAMLHRLTRPEDLAEVLRVATEQGWPEVATVFDDVSIFTDLTAIPPDLDLEAMRRAVELELERWAQFPPARIPGLDTFIPPQPTAATRTISAVELDLTSVLPETGEHDVWDVVQRERQTANGRREVRLDLYPAVDHGHVLPSGVAAPINPQLTISLVQLDLEHWAVSAEGETFTVDAGVLTWTTEEDDLVAGITFIKDRDANA